jgi:hypothetical protein
MIPVSFLLGTILVWFVAIRPHLRRRERALFVTTAEEDWASPIPLALRRREGERRLRRWDVPKVHGPRHVPELAGLAWVPARTSFVELRTITAGDPYRVVGGRVVTYERCLSERWWR